MRIERSYGGPGDPIDAKERELAFALKELEYLKKYEKYLQDKEAFAMTMRERYVAVWRSRIRIVLAITAAAAFIVLCFFHNKFQTPIYQLAGLLTIAGFTTDWRGLIERFKKKDQ